MVGAILTLFPLASAAAPKPPAPIFRADLVKKLTPLFCETTSAVTPHKMWARGVYEAQIQGKIYEPLRANVVSGEFLKLQALRQAQTNFHHSYAYGVCKSGYAWLVSAPAPALSVTRKKEQWHVAIPKAREHCRTLSFDFAPKEKIQSRELAVITPSHFEEDNFVVDAKKVGDGLLSVTCIQSADVKRGAALWFLLPLGSGAAAEIPFQEKLLQHKDPDASLVLWINELRRGAKLPPLEKGDARTDRPLSRLAASRTILHDRELLRDEATKLEKKHLQLLGENRAIGTNLLDIAWMFWNSPRHRGLLLNPAADHVSIDHQTLGNQQLVVIVMTKAKS